MRVCPFFTVRANSASAVNPAYRVSANTGRNAASPSSFGEERWIALLNAVTYTVPGSSGSNRMSLTPSITSDVPGATPLPDTNGDFTGGTHARVHVLPPSLLR